MVGDFVIKSVSLFRILKWHIVFAILFGCFISTMVTFGFVKHSNHNKNYMANVEFIVANVNRDVNIREKEHNQNRFTGLDTQKETYKLYASMIKSDGFLKKVSQSFFGDQSVAHISLLKKQSVVKDSESDSFLKVAITDEVREDAKALANIVGKNFQNNVKQTLDLDNVKLYSEPKIYPIDESYNAKYVCVSAFIVSFIVWLSVYMFFITYKRVM